MLKSKIDNLFTIEPENVLNDINLKINDTIYSIEKFNSHLNTFKISEELINYLNGYGETKIKPIYESFINLLNNETKHTVILYIEGNYKNYEKYLNLRDFIEQSNNISLKFENNYIDKIKENINSYGINNYPEYLENEINRQNERNKMRRSRLLSNEEFGIINNEKNSDKALDDIFKILLTSSNNTKTYINNFEKFDEFDKLITKYINKVNSAYKLSQKIILDNNYEEEILNALNDKLENLKQMSLNYYKQINESYYKVKKHIIKSINDINTDLNECANITYNTIEDKYNLISKQVESLNKEESEISQEKIENNFIVENQNQITTVNYVIFNMTKKTNIKYDLTFEDNGMKKPNVNINIINQNKPKKMNFDLIKSLNGCGRIVESIEIEFNDVNYTMNVDFNTKSNDINLTTITNFEAYQYNKEIYQIEEESFSECFFILGINICIEYTTCD